MPGQLPEFFSFRRHPAIRHVETKYRARYGPARERTGVLRRFFSNLFRLGEANDDIDLVVGQLPPDTIDDLVAAGHAMQQQFS